MSHYFENDQKLQSNLKKTTAYLLSHQFTFYTDNGVFAKNGLDYGSKLLLESLPAATIKGHVLDVGCGYGALGIVLNKVYNVKVDMIDINKRALHLAKKNQAENHCHQLKIYESNIYQQVTDPFDIIITNPPIRAGKKILYEILLGAKEHLIKGGLLYFVVRKDQGAKSIISDLKKVYDITIINKSKGFYIIQAEND